MTHENGAGELLFAVAARIKSVFAKQDNCVTSYYFPIAGQVTDLFITSLQNGGVRQTHRVRTGFFISVVSKGACVCIRPREKTRRVEARTID